MRAAPQIFLRAARTAPPPPRLHLGAPFRAGIFPRHPGPRSQSFLKIRIGHLNLPWKYPTIPANTRLEPKYEYRKTYGPWKNPMVLENTSTGRRGHGRPPEAPPSRVWALGHTLSSFFGFSSENQALPPLSLSGQHASNLSPRHSDGAVQHQSLADQDVVPSNGSDR